MISRCVKFLLLLSCFFFFMCSNKKDGNDLDETAIENILISKPHYEKFSNVYELNKIIKLQTIEESIFAVPSKIVIADLKIFILDQTRDYLLVFDERGNFIKKLGSKGKGPKEYLSIASFSVNEKDNEILFYDDYNSSIFYYSLDSLNFKKQERINFSFHTFENFESSLIFYRSLFPVKGNDSLSFDIIVTDYDNPQNIVNKFFPYDYYNGTRGHTEKLLKTKENFFFYKNYSDTIYSYKLGYFTPKYVISFYNSKIPDVDFYKDRRSFSNNEIGDELLKDNYIYSYRFFSTTQHILISYFSKGKHFSYIKDFLSGNELSIDVFEDDLGFCLNNREPDFFTEDLVGFVIYPSIIDAYKDKGADINAELQSLDIEDNPYLVLFSLKDL